MKGGAKLSADQSTFSFELNETVHFAKGQEIAEIKGISLEPNISIQPYTDYIAIRGVIELSGEYLKEESEEEDHLNFDDFDAKRYVERVSDLEGNEAMFHHRFPVEISVPSYRITHLDDVRISIDAFDYELPDESKLTLFATILIHGINEEETLFERYEDDVHQIMDDEPEELSSASAANLHEEETNINENKELDVHVQEDVAEAINREQDAEEVTIEEEVVVKEDPPEDANAVAEHIEKEEFIDREESEQETFQFELIRQEQKELTDEDGEPEEVIVSKEENDPDPERWPFKEKTQTLAEFFKQTTEQTEQETEYGVDEFSQEAEDSGEREENSDNTQEETKEDISSLSDLFRNSEEESYTKMRICIVQDEDTIETISERFAVSPLQLIKQNKLTEDFDVEPGQLLYIPVKSKD